MTLIKYTDVARNTRGDSLPDYRLQVVTSAGAGVDIYSDGSGTRFRDGSGNVVNYATANSSGKVEFYWTPATGQILQVLDTSGTLVDTDADFADKYVIANLAGEVPQASVTDLEDDLAAKAAVADLSSSDAAKGAALVKRSDGLTVQDAASKEPLLVDAFYEAGDGTDDAPSFERAFAAAVTDRRSIACTPGKSYRLLTSVDITPEADGWTAPLLGNNAKIILGAAVPTIAHEAAGFRYRGIKSGASANATRPRINNLLIDAQNIAFSNGVRAIGMENASGWVFDNVDGENYTQGYHIVNVRYADGGAVGSIPGKMVNCDVRGAVIASIPGTNWYPYSDVGDLATVSAGGSVAAGAKALIAVPQSGTTGTGMPNIAAGQVWTNPTGSPIAVPATVTEANLTSAGFTKDSTPYTHNSVTVSGDVYMYYTTGGAKVAYSPVAGGANIVQDCYFYGGRYGAYTQGSAGAQFIRVTTEQATRGIVAEWSATGVRIEDCRVRETLSSGVLLGYGCTGYRISGTTVECLTSRWVGEALFNIQLSSGYGKVINCGTSTRDNVTDGQYHLHIAVNSPNVVVDGFDAEGDCLRAYVCIESAWNSSISGANPEHYPQSSFYGGAASVDMTGIELRNVVVRANTTKAAAAGATAFCFMQVTDAVNGDIGLPAPKMIGCQAESAKHVRTFKIYEGSTTAKQINSMVLEECLFKQEASPTTAATRMVLPRKWAHFARVANVTNLDDNLERAVPNVATPDLTFGKYWFDSGSTTLNGILGGQGATFSEGYEGREIIVRGNSSRAWSTVSGVSGTRDGLRLTGSPITPTSVQRMRLTFNRTVFSWIGGLV